MFILNYFKSMFVESRPWFRTVALWFLGSVGLGVAVFFIYPELLEQILAMFAERFGVDPALDLDLAQEIFLQNLLASAIALFGGLLLGLAPFLVVVSNGFLIGFVLTSIFFLPGLSIGQTLGLLAGGTLPHGIFEIPALLLASAFGLRLGIGWLKPAAKGQRVFVFKNDLLQGLRFIPGIILLLAIAAVIEVFISGKIVDRL